MSPAAILMKFFRNFPEICASTTCPLASCTLNIVPGRTATTLPSTSIALLSDDMVNAELDLGAAGHGDVRQKHLVRQKRPALVKASCCPALSQFEFGTVTSRMWHGVGSTDKA